MQQIKEFIKYFFSNGDAVEFRNFTIPHFLPIILMILIIFLIYKFRDKLKNFKHEDKLRLTLAFMLIITEMSYFWRLVGVEELNANALEHLPITVCGWAIIFCSFLVLTKSQALFDISYFWVFSGTIFALITPTVITYAGPTRFRYYQFWCEHTLGYITIFYMIFVHNMRPTIKSALRSYIWLGVLALIAYFANRMLGPGANYLFMAELEETPSILDILPKNFIVRVIVMASVITLLFGIAYLPWYIKDKMAKKIMNE